MICLMFSEELQNLELTSLNFKHFTTFSVENIVRYCHKINS